MKTDKKLRILIWCIVLWLMGTGLVCSIRGLERDGVDRTLAEDDHKQ